MAKQVTSGPWARFRGFRRSRPFWAGGFTIVAGGEILVFPLTPVSSLIQLGIGAISGVLFGIALVILGLFMWFSPPNRTLAGVLTILIALASFITTNLGGLVVGMVLGLIGGGLCLAWTQKAPPPRKRRKRRFPWTREPVRRSDEPSEESSGTADTAPQTPQPRRPRPRPMAFRRTMRGRWAVGVAALLATLLGASLAVPGVAVAQECFLGLLCQEPRAGSTTTPTPEPDTPEPSPGGGLGELSDGLSGALGALPVPALPALTPAQVPLLAQLIPQLITPVLPTVVPQEDVVVSGLISNTTMDSLTVTNFRFLGVVTHQVAGGGTIRALRVVVDSTDIANLGAHLPGHVTSMLVNQTAGAAHATTGQLILDFTKLKITLFGVLPLEFSFAFPPPPLITIPVLSGTDVDIDFVQLDTNATIPGVAVAIGPASDGAQTTDTSPPVDSRTSLAGLVGLASALDQPTLLAPYGLSDTQARQAMAAYEKDPAALSAPSEPST
ncbi:MAG: DUF6114 domain-containing protein [Pseudonocardia sp.]|nr:DUF6114 domain-containing protein [Pseudonocardia sp.]